MITVRPARVTDAASWLCLRRALWPDGSEDEHRAEIDRFLAGRAEEPQAVLVAVDGGGRVVGLAELSIRPCAEGCLTDRDSPRIARPTTPAPQRLTSALGSWKSV